MIRPLRFSHIRSSFLSGIVTGSGPGAAGRGRWGSLAHAVAAAALCASLALGTASCSDDAAGPPAGPQGDALGLVLSSTDRTLTVFSVESPSDAFTVGLAPDGSPVTMAVHGAMAAVPLGTVPAVALVDLEARAVAHTVPLPEGSGATGAAFLNDSLIVVANPGRNSVSIVNVRTGEPGDEIEVGTYPQGVAAVNDTAYVLNANLGPDFSPQGPATVSVLAESPPRVIQTIPLSGLNAGAAAVTQDGRLVVVNSGSFGAGNGSVSIVARGALVETQHLPEFGDFPGSLAVSPDGRIYTGSFSYGVAVWDPAAAAFAHSPAEAVEPDGIDSVSGIGFDEDGRLYTLVPDCQEPSRALRLDTAYEVELEIPTGICPFAIEFTRLP